MDSRRTALVLLAGAALLAAVFAFGKRTGAPAVATAPTAETRSEERPVPEPVAIHRPGGASIEVGVFTSAPEGELAKLADPKAAAALLDSKHCGDAAACAKVRSFVVDEARVQLTMRPGDAWRNPRPADLAEAASTLTPAERDAFTKMPRVVVFAASGPRTSEQLPIRAAFALAAALAEKTRGYVYDPVIDRVETPAQFLAHAVTEPLGASAFRRDRVDFQFMARDEQNVRLISTGMSRYGGPDLEVQRAPRAVAAKLVDVLAALAKKVADGAEKSPIAIGLPDLAAVADGGAPVDPDAGTLAVDLLDVHPEDGDPNDVMARVIPPEGATIEGYEGLVDSLYGPSAAGWDPPTEDDFRVIRDKTQKAIAGIIARYKAARGDGGDAELYVQLPFLPTAARERDAAPDANDVQAFEWMWIEVRSIDEKTGAVTGVLVDDPEDVPAMSKGDSVTRRRDEIADYLLKLPDGTTESGSGPVE